jgi:AmmeMemoRadiSam system protein B
MMCEGIDRPPAVAGSFYSADPVVLRREIEGFLSRAEALAGGREVPVGLVVPHAGYMFSGGVAASAYKLIKGCEFDLVVVVSPSHHKYFPGFSIYQSGNYVTPLGGVEIDRELATELISTCSWISYVPEAHSHEHALEVQLPFLQVCLEEFRLLPLVMGEQSWAQAEKLAVILSGLTRERKVLFVASSDLSHFYPAAKAEVLDRRVIDAVAAFDPVSFWALIETGQAEACGAGPLLAVMLAIRHLGMGRAEILSYHHSGEICGDYNRVVGYLAAAFYHRDKEE